jgi:hypothetical protein
MFLCAILDSSDLGDEYAVSHYFPKYQQAH